MNFQFSKSAARFLAVFAFCFPQFHATEDLGKVAAFGDLNCIACHIPSGNQSKWISSQLAPQMAILGDRVAPDWLLRFLTSPERTVPRITMPDVLHGDAEQAEALTHDLMAKQKPEFQRVIPDRAAAALGESLCHSIGCVACHALRNGAVIPLNSVLLPIMHSTDAAEKDVAHYLLSDTKWSASAIVAFYRGRIRALENLDSTVVSRISPLAGLILEGPMLVAKAAFRITTWIDFKAAGEYTYFLTAIGASRLSVAGRWILGEESWETEKVGANYQIDLFPGRHELKLDYVKRGKEGAALSVEWKGPSFKRQQISVALMSSVRQPMMRVSEEIPVFKFDSAKAEKGRRLNRLLNYDTCYEGKLPTLALLNLSSMNLARGCLSVSPSGVFPDYHLDPQSRDEIREIWVKTNVAASVPKEHVLLKMNGFRSVACHLLDGSPGIVLERAAFFTSSVHDLGVQCRVPSNLDGVGDKLRLEWLQMIYVQVVTVRPYLNIRMHQFGVANVGHLADVLVSLDRQARPVSGSSDTSEVQKEAGRKLVETDGLSCIAFHRFNDQPAHFMEVLDLTRMTGRLNEDWFRRFLHDLDTFQPETRTPSLWSSGRSLLPTLLDVDTKRQHAALWTYLVDGSKAKFSEGMNRKNLEIIGGTITEKGQIFVGGNKRVWPVRGLAEYALQRLDWTGKLPFEIKTMRINSDGFEPRFTEAVDPVSAESPDTYTLETFTHHYHEEYGGPELEHVDHLIKSAKVSEDRLSVRLVADHLVTEHVHKLHLAGVLDHNGKPLMHETDYYTLNRIQKN